MTDRRSLSVLTRFARLAPRQPLVATFVLVASTALTGQASAPPVCEVAGSLQRANSPAFDVAAVGEVYRVHGPTCAWDDGNAAALIAAVKGASEHGLDPALFHAEMLSESDAPANVSEAADRDVVLSDAAIKYALALSRGISAGPVASEDEPAGSKPHSGLIRGLVKALNDGEIEFWLQRLAPQTEPYERLKAALTTYRSIAENGGWGQLPATMPKKGKRKAAFVRLLRERLVVEGDLSLDDGSPRFDEEVRLAVERFQARTGLKADGKVDAKTIARLNVSAAERVAQIELNMERHRAALRDLPATRVEVNAPAATAALYRDGSAYLKMNAVVGTPDNATPTLSSKINTVVLNPPWVIPQSIIRNEIKPLLKRRPDYLTENRMYWSGDNLIQEPGPHNALGHIKFEFPNRYSVYLHDTPARKLFLTPERAQSHGCVRLERPLDLAEELLRDDGEWTREAIEEGIRAGETKRIAVPDPMPVMITYQTAFVGDDGLVHFVPDLYGHDLQLTLAVAQRVALLKSEPAQW